MCEREREREREREGGEQWNSGEYEVREGGTDELDLEWDYEGEGFFIFILWIFSEYRSSREKCIRSAHND